MSERGKMSHKKARKSARRYWKILNIPTSLEAFIDRCQSSRATRIKSNCAQESDKDEHNQWLLLESRSRGIIHIRILAICCASWPSSHSLHCLFHNLIRLKCDEICCEQQNQENSCYESTKESRCKTDSDTKWNIPCDSPSSRFKLMTRFFIINTSGNGGTGSERLIRTTGAIDSSVICCTQGQNLANE